MTSVLTKFHSLSRRAALKRGAASIGSLLVFFTGTPTLSARAASGGTITAEPADAATRARMLAQAAGDRDFQRLEAFLRQSGLAASGDGVVVVAKKDGALLRTVAAVPFSGAGAAAAVLAFGIEAGGQIFAQAIVDERGQKVAHTVGVGGVIQTFHRPSNVAADCDPLSCFICSVLCGGLCGIGCGLACIVICGPNVLCTIVCAGICGGICGGGCAVGCTGLGFCC